MRVLRLCYSAAGVMDQICQTGRGVTTAAAKASDYQLWRIASSYLVMIDTLMMEYTVEMVSVERVLTCIQKCTPFLLEEVFPYDAEEAVTTWINKFMGPLWLSLTCPELTDT
ncbi:hypothetical protein G5714_002254 [Onychostoma macrolepis]|uniref:Uncharacterized protein n=1 Tax=Onychostoma macrolepis TaxID=369639 RepID=A0A7J6DEY8_9TELE|nr:hypothetical protein G5714_002254 [Onychostoma macrolepis]